MRIVHISDCYAPRLGGIETQVRALAIRQAEQGHDVHVITATPSPTVRNGSEVLDGVNVHRVTARMPADLPVHPRVRKEIRAALSAGGVAAGADAVHVHTVGLYRRSRIRGPKWREAWACRRSSRSMGSGAAFFDHLRSLLIRSRHGHRGGLRLPL